MNDHVPMRAEDYDEIDETTLETHDGHPVTVILSVPLDSADYDALSAVAARDGRTLVEAALDALHQYATALTPPRRSAR